MSLRTTRLPEGYGMFDRLVKVNNNQHLQDRFYPLLLEIAGLDITADRLALHIVLSIDKYYTERGNWGPRIHLSKIAPEFVDAIVDEMDFAREVKALL